MPDSRDDLAERFAGTAELAALVPFNANKASEYAAEPDDLPRAGEAVVSADPLVGSAVR